LAHLSGRSVRRFWPISLAGPWGAFGPSLGQVPEELLVHASSRSRGSFWPISPFYFFLQGSRDWLQSIVIPRSFYILCTAIFCCKVHTWFSCKTFEHIRLIISIIRCENHPKCLWKILKAL
jgi:hypothetical protein